MKAFYFSLSVSIAYLAIANQVTGQTSISSLVNSLAAGSGVNTPGVINGRQFLSSKIHQNCYECPSWSATLAWYVWCVMYFGRQSQGKANVCHTNAIQPCFGWHLLLNNPWPLAWLEMRWACNNLQCKGSTYCTTWVHTHVVCIVKCLACKAISCSPPSMILHIFQSSPQQ